MGSLLSYRDCHLLMWQQDGQGKDWGLRVGWHILASTSTRPGKALPRVRFIALPCTVTFLLLSLRRIQVAKHWSKRKHISGNYCCISDWGLSDNCSIDTSVLEPYSFLRKIASRFPSLLSITVKWTYAHTCFALGAPKCSLQRSFVGVGSPFLKTRRLSVSLLWILYSAAAGVGTRSKWNAWS
jgi:hypothetical protein